VSPVFWSEKVKQEIKYPRNSKKGIGCRWGKKKFSCIWVKKSKGLTKKNGVGPVGYNGVFGTVAKGPRARPNCGKKPPITV